MTLMQAVEAARDFAGLAALLLFALLAAFLWTGATGVTAGVAAAIAAAAAGGVLAIAFYGLLGAATGASGGVIAVVGAIIVILCGFLSAHYYGVRGFWVFCAMSAGAGVGATLLWLFTKGATAPVGPMAPMMAAAVMLLVVFGALGSVQAAAGAEAAQRKMRFSAADLTAPPFWFDCAYGTFGGSAENRASCPFTPPEAPEATWAENPDAPDETDLALDAAARAALEGGADPATMQPPAATLSPGAPDLSNPDFDTESAAAARTAASPEGLAAPETAVGAGEARRSSSEGGAEEPAAPPAPPAALPGVAGPDAPAIGVGPDIAATIGDAAPMGQATNFDTAPPGAPAPERMRERYVCFSALGAAAERLCPDQTLSPRDLKVVWNGPDGEAEGETGSIDCYFDPDLALHTTVVVNLSGALDREIARASGGGRRRADAIYDMVTVLAGAARSGGDSERDQLFMSMYLVGGSPLREPWAAQSFGVDESDRLFDIRSPRQTLSLLRYLRTETEALGSGALRGDLAFAIDQAIEQRPSAPMERGESLILVVVDSVDAASLDKAAALKLGAAAEKAGLPVFVVEIGEDRGAPGLRVLAERSGGALFRAEDAETLKEVAEGILRRSRSFCAVRVSAPEGFFERGSVELTLRRRLQGACVWEQVAVVDCDGVRTTQRIRAEEF